MALSPFARYQQHGWALVPLTPGKKAPTDKGWNREALCLTSEDDVRGVTHAGLAHAYSGTCAIDIDDLELAVPEMRKLGIDLVAMLRAPDAVRLSSGRPNRAKLIYALPEPLPSYKVVVTVEGKKRDIIDFRCATKGGLSVQDALPPTIHPDTLKPYTWKYNDPLVGDWKALPALPDKLHRYWQSRITATPEKAPVDRDYGDEELLALLGAFDPDDDYQSWVNVGMALHHATGGDERGLKLWDQWSADGDKYKGEADLWPHWNSFQGDGITVDYLYAHQVAAPEEFDIVDVSDDPIEASKKVMAERFQAVRIGEWVQRPPPRWLIENVLPEADLAMVFGASGTGKSFFALDMAMAVALGREWREKPTVKGPVLWIAAEAAGSVRNRALAYARHNDAELSAADLWIVGDTPSLGDIEHVRAIAKAAKPIAPKLIVIDTLAAASGGANENSGEDMSVVLSACRALHRVTGGLVLLIHHSGKDAAKGARGWSGIKAAMQTEVEVTVDATGCRKARIAKQRDAEQDLEFAFKLSPVSLDPFDDRPQNSCAVEAVEGVVLVDAVPHAGLIAAALEMFFEQGTLEISQVAVERSVTRAAMAAGEDIVEVGADIENVATVLTQCGQARQDGGALTLLKIPGLGITDEEDLL